MGIFGGRKKERKRGRMAAKRAAGFSPQMFHAPPDIRKKVPASREYRIFKRSQRRRRSWYETVVRASSRILLLSPDRQTKEDLESAIAFTGLRIRPEGVMSLFVVTLAMFALLAAVLFVAGAAPVAAVIVIVLFGIGMGYYFLRYPVNLAKSIRIKASEQIVLAILYMVVSMRISPNLERAMRFAATNIRGELAWDMRRLIWDIEIGSYFSASEAMDEYIKRWKTENEEFSDALRLVRDSQVQSYDRAKIILDEAMRVVLDGTKTRMKHYTQDLKLPIMIIHMMGIVLPILGTVMAPVAAIFLSDALKPEYFILGYNIILPAVLIWFIKNTLQKRPVTFSQVDISRHPYVPRDGHMIVNKRNMPVLPIAVLIFAMFAIPSVYYFMENPEMIVSGGQKETFIPLVMSLLLIIGFGISLAVYFILSNFQKIRIYNEIEKIEGEFELALFQLGNKIRGGTPIELALEKSLDEVKDLKISKLFQICLRNMRMLGMTFEDAMFNREFGAIRYYPSIMIKNIMSAIIETSKRGLVYASEGMLRISNYLRNIRETQEYIRDILEETVSSMKFQAYVLTPVITGLIVSMAQVIMQILGSLGELITKATVGGGAAGGIGNIFGDPTKTMSTAFFQIIVGVYMLEVIVILGIFLTKINRGENQIIQWYTTGKLLIVSVTVYFAVAFISSTLFSGLIAEALGNIFP